VQQSKSSGTARTLMPLIAALEKYVVSQITNFQTGVNVKK